MKTVLDLIRKYDELTEMKGRETLPPEDEEHWEELKVVYDLLMFHSGLGREEGKRSPFSPEEIRECLSDDTRLRVPVEAHAIVNHNDESFDANVVNLSRGGTFLASDTLADVGERLIVYISGISSDDPGDVLELDGEVIWCAERGVPEARVHRGMGVRFVDVSDDTRKRLESFVVRTIERRLSSLG